MTIQIPFNYIPSLLRVPGTYVEVNNSQANTAQQTLNTLLIGQVLAGGTLGPIAGTTSAATSSSSATLHFSATPAGLVPGMLILDLTTSAVIAPGTTIVSVTGTTVVMSADALSAGVAMGDSIQFQYPVAPVLISSARQAAGLFGVGSMLANMCATYRQGDSFGTLYALPLIDDPAAVAATATISIAGTVSLSQTLFLYVCGVPVPVLVKTSMANSDIAVAIVNAINAQNTLPVTASGSSFPVTLTAKNLGAVGNSLDCRVNYYGSRNGEVTPAGLTVTISAFASGATNPSLTAGLASLGSHPFDLIGTPYSDDVSLDAIKLFLNDATGRWSWEQEIYGHHFTVMNLDVADATEEGNDRNNQHESIMAIFKSPSETPRLVSALVAAAAQSLRADPGLPLQTLPMIGVLAPAVGDQFLISDRETLLENGISTSRVSPDGTLRIDRVITTYQFDAFDTPDNSYLNVERMFLIAYTSRYVRDILSSKYARVKLADDGTRIPQGSNIVTPSVVRGELISIYGNLVDQGICQDFDTFAAAVVCQRNLTDVNRLDILFPADFIDQLNVVAISLMFTP